ncbi:MAG: excinuclease ABC subunit B [Lachnospiraceae bacterium]|nr:excinuclease ABC subunit B [Lachnospiraceae bacterium]
MLCERCKIREANIQYTEVINGVRTEHNFCAQCAKEMDFGPYSAIFDSDFPLGKLLSGLLGVGESQEHEKTHQVVCPTCGTSYEEFIKNSRFGCADCYGVFDILISDNIKQLQGNDTHKGKEPRYHIPRAGDHFSAEALSGEPGTGQTGEEDQVHSGERLRILEARLKEAIAKEEYEAAAGYRDQIRSLRKEQETG